MEKTFNCLTIKKNLLFLAAFFLFVCNTQAQIYHPDDKEGLRAFLRQPSALAGQINAQRLGLSVIDTLNWQDDETWIGKVSGLMWNDSSPKRLTNVGAWVGRNLAGVLNCNMWTELFGLICDVNQITYIDVSNNSALGALTCSNNQITHIDVSNNTQLEAIMCYDNHLPLTDLFAISTMVGYTWLGAQRLSPLFVHPGTELFEDQSVFNGVYTDYIVTKNDTPAPAEDYTVTNGKITFNNSGFYEVTMTNDAITSNETYPAKVMIDIVVLGAPVITTTTLPSCVIGYAYSETLSAIGITPITWALESGNLPTGLTLSSNGTISGTPSQEGVFIFTVKATNNIGSSIEELSINILAAEFSGGNGTEVYPYIITTQYELAQLATYVNAGNTDYNDKFYKLNNDIELSAYQAPEEWTQIGWHYLYPFKGHFDGNCKKITELFMALDSLSYTCLDGAGLFGYVVGGTIKDLGLENVNIIGAMDVGSIAGLITNSTITNCYSTGLIRARNNGGGIVGRMENSIISNCYSTYDLIIGHNGNGLRVGGIAGKVSDGSTGYSRIINCYYTGTIRGTSAIGGMVGDLAFSESTLLSNNIVLSSRIEVMDEHRFGGRITGRYLSVFVNNAAWDGILNIDGTTNWAPKGATSINGEDMSIESIFADGTLGGRFTEENGWTIENGKLPGLCGCAVDMPEHLRLPDAPHITTENLPNGMINTPYNQTLAATGTAPITWSLASGNLPTGLELSSAGTISGTPTDTGTFNFTVQATNSIGNATKALAIKIEDGVGISENEMLGIRIYPNPTTGELNLIQEQVGIAGQARNDVRNIEVFDVYGKNVSSHHLITSSSHHLINISHLPTGIYFLRIITEQGETVRKVLKI